MRSQHADTAENPDGQLANAISTMVVRVLRDHTGRGPTKSRTHLGDEVIAVILQNTLTPAERTLAANGRTDILLATRRAFQDTMRPDLIAGVEQLTGRTVAAAFSDQTISPDIALEFFMLAPEEGAQAASAAA